MPDVPVALRIVCTVYGVVRYAPVWTGPLYDSGEAVCGKRYPYADKSTQIHCVSRVAVSARTVVIQRLWWMCMRDGWGTIS